MERPFVEWVRVEEHRCVRQADLHLTPLHALIGPNDSGKSTLLRAIQSRSATMWVRGVGARNSQGRYALTAYPAFDRLRPQPDELVRAVDAATVPAAVLRLDPDSLRRRSQLIPSDSSLWFQDEKGAGLPALVDALLSRDVAGYVQLNERFKALFPTVSALWLENKTSTEKAIGVTLRDGTRVSAEWMSEGMLYWLAIAIIHRLDRRAVVLVEEPENGLHPARIAEVMRVLRDLSLSTQVVIATHSPLVINELQPEEVTIVTRTPERGTICTPMTATKNFAMRSKTYSLGELWLSYADGDLEKELVGEPDATAQAG